MKISSAHPIILIPLLWVCSVQAQSPLSVQTTARLTLFPSIGSETLDQQYEAGAFFDVAYLEKFGAGVGLVYQDQRYSNNDKISNQLYHYKLWYAAYPESLPGSLNFALSAYRQENSDYRIETTTTGSGAGPGMGSRRITSTVTRSSDSLDIINPEIFFLNYDKSLYFDIGYASSEYRSSEVDIGNLDVRQWTASGGFALNERYDWLQLRGYYIDLSNDQRSPGTDSTAAALLSWTHWLKSLPARLESITLKALFGRRIYAVDSEIRKVYNLSDVEKGNISFGSHWRFSEDTRLYLYLGYEAFEDLADEQDYNSVFVDMAISTRW